MRLRGEERIGSSLPRETSDSELELSHIVNTAGTGRRFLVHWALRAGRLLFRASVDHLETTLAFSVGLKRRVCLAAFRGYDARRSVRCQRYQAACGALEAHASRAHAWVHAPRTAARRLVGSRFARATGARSAASAQSAQVQLSGARTAERAHKAEQHGSLAQHDAVYKTRFIAAAGMTQSSVPPSVSPAQAAAGGVRPPCADPCWMPASASPRTPPCLLNDVAALCCTGLSSVLVFIPCASLTAVWHNLDT